MYGKIFESIYDGTISVNWKAMIVFQQMIVLCGSDGVIDMTPPAISRRTNIPIDIIEEGIEFLQKPDPYSRSKKEEGRRIVLIDETRNWGWRIVNHKYYRDLASHEDKKEKDRIRIANKREQEKASKNNDVAECRSESQMSPIQDTNTYTNTLKEKPVYPPELNIEKWEEYKVYRKKRKIKPLLPESEAKKIEELIRLSKEDQARCIDSTISNGYQGVFPDNFNGKPNGKRNSGEKMLDAIRNLPDG